jgi:hypothetical protein
VLYQIGASIPVLKSPPLIPSLDPLTSAAMEASIGPESGPNNTRDPSSTIWERFDAYPFPTDSEFKRGLGMLLSQPASSITEERIKSDDPLVLRAKAFYFSRYAYNWFFTGHGF